MGHELVRSIAQARHAQGPHVHEIFLAFDQPGHVGRITGLVRARTIAARLMTAAIPKLKISRRSICMASLPSR